MPRAGVSRGRRGGAAGVLVGALAIAGLAGVLGVGHSLLRDTPIRLTREAGPVAVTPGADAGPVDGTGDAASDGLGGAAVYDPDAVFEMTPEELLGAAVLPGMITLGEAKALFEEGAVFVDARRRDVYEAGHIEGAIWLPAEEVAARWVEIEHAVGVPIVIYCEGGPCDASHNTAIRIEDLGMGFDPADLHIMGLGYAEWERAGLPTGGGGSP